MIVTVDKPSFEIERTPCVDGNPITAVSIGKVTDCSTSDGGRPRTLGDDDNLIVCQIRKRIDRNSGRYEQAAHDDQCESIASVSQRLSSAKSMIRFSMTGYSPDSFIICVFSK